METMEAKNFEHQIGMTFQPHGGDVSLTLVKIERQTQTPGFILLFQAPQKPILPEGLYEFAVEDGTTHTFHIMPIHTPTPGHQDYQAIFN